MSLTSLWLLGKMAGGGSEVDNVSPPGGVVVEPFQCLHEV